MLLLSGGVVGAAAGQSAGAATVQPLPMSSVDAAVAEASRRFGVPESWIRDVMRVESAGDPRAVSHAGAIGLMQVMPGTYAELRARHALGPDPFNVRDNVLAGTAYLREMFDRYGARGMLAYNAGPGRWEDHLAGIRPLPAETVGYLARLGPTLDVGAAVAPSIAVPPRARSPFEAPLFVSLAGRSAAQGETVATRDLRQVVAANTTVAPFGGELFVRRAPAADPLSEPSPDSALSAASPSPTAQETAPDPVPISPASSLLPPRRVEPRR